MAKNKYISQDAAIDAVDVCNLHRGIIDALQAIISDIPAADVRPVVRGEWANEHLASTSGGTYAVIRCSVCKSQFPLYKTNYCPSCGADMREAKEDG